MQWIARPLLLAAVFFLLAGCSTENGSSGPILVTEYGTGPDKWATAWLLTRHVYPHATLRFVEAGEKLPDGYAFDVPSADIQRTADKSAFEAAVLVHKVDVPAIQQLTGIIHDIEVNYWGGARRPEAPIVDQAFRSLHRGLGAEPTAAQCYLAFFDAVYAALAESERAGQPFAMPESAVSCEPDAASASGKAALVEEMPIDEILAQLAAGKKVAFVDVREPGEFSEAHIPGALNITLRNVSENAVAPLREANVVVSYCVKDFRGFEMAKTLKQMGIENSVILNPYGIKGWVAQGLPVVGRQGLTKQQGEQWLSDCRSGGACLETPFS